MREQLSNCLEEKYNASKPGKKRLLEKKFASLSYNYRAFLNGTDYGVILMDTRGRIKVFNAGAEKMLGYDVLEVVDKQTIITFHDKAELILFLCRDKKTSEIDFSFYAQHIASINNKNHEWTFVKKNGKTFVGQLSFKEILNENKDIIGYLAILEDITQRKRMEEELKISEEKHRLFFENSQGLMCTHNQFGEILTINEAGAKLIGYKPHEIIGKTLYDLTPQILKSRLDSYIQTMIEKRFDTGLVKIKHKDGSFKVLFFRNVKIDFENDCYIIGNAIDVSSRIELENNMRRAKELAEKANQAKDDFLANMSHEIRTPMNAIIGFTDILLDTALNGEQKECLDAIKSAGQNLLGIINDILDFSKIQSGKLTLEMYPFSLKDLVHNTCALLKIKANEKNLALHVSIDSSIPENLHGDQVRINQILYNLIGNAIKFTESGSVTVSVQMEKDDGLNCKIKFLVRDTGIGIASDKLEAIFDRFTQASSETTRKYGGTGLGLSISKNLISIHGGELEVASKINHGSVFSFSLLFSHASEPKTYSKQRNLADVLPLGKVKVLLVEDNDLNQKLAKKVISNFNFEYYLAENGRIAVEKLRTEKFDIVLMDLQMPEMDGYQATKAIRDELKLNVPIMAMTAHSLVGEMDKCISVGMNDYISKPFKADDLYYKIVRLVNNNQSTFSAEGDMFESKEMDGEESVSISMLKEISGGSKAFEKEIIELFIKNAKRDVEIIRKAIINQDKEIIRQKMHGLKSSLLIFGLNQLAQELSTIENSDDPLAIAAIKISEIRRRIMNAGEELTKILAQY